MYPFFKKVGIKLTNAQKASYQLTPYLEEVIVGCTLGDLTIERRRKSLTANSRLRFEQSTINKDYLFHLYELFKPYCVSAPAERVRTRKDGSKFEGIHTAWYFGTLTLPCFNPFRKLFYTAEGKKVIPTNIKQLLTPVSLAYWAMDDGTKHSSGFRLQTDSYSENEVKLLVKTLQDKFELAPGGLPTRGEFPGELARREYLPPDRSPF